MPAVDGLTGHIVVGSMEADILEETQLALHIASEGAQLDCLELLLGKLLERADLVQQCVTSVYERGGVWGAGRVIGGRAFGVEVSHGRSVGGMWVRGRTGEGTCS